MKFVAAILNTLVVAVIVSVHGASAVKLRGAMEALTRKLQDNGADVGCITITGIDGTVRTPQPCNTAAPVSPGTGGDSSSSDSED
ncbi:expressed unknown protein [Seminavis robusta]|uniref:Uncharacterized protein n=1 Tax=Seminavis robusta TaxID=568900 RepID=A0A9N8HDM0_9STRA|nr:expressed unknown protein [Seminavis robusta]|eukprot:Sro349_g123520.1 n/a (85) ;mRNA; r:47517-47771